MLVLQRFCSSWRSFRYMLCVVTSLSLVFGNVVSVSAEEVSDYGLIISDDAEVYYPISFLDETDATVHGCTLLSGEYRWINFFNAADNSNQQVYQGFAPGTMYYNTTDVTKMSVQLPFEDFYSETGTLFIDYAIECNDVTSLFYDLYLDGEYHARYNLGSLNDTLEIPVSYQTQVKVQIIVYHEVAQSYGFALAGYEFISTEDLENSSSSEESQGLFDLIRDFFSTFFDNFFNKIVDALKSLFIPEDGYFKEYFNKLMTFFDEKLGFLYAPIEILVELLNAILDADGSDSGLTFPGVKWEDTYIIEPQTISLKAFGEEFPELQDAVYFATDVLMVGALLWLFQIKLRAVLSN